MRPFPWIIRVGLFAVGFGAGLSHYKPPSTPQHIVLELRIERAGSNAVFASEPVASQELLPCTNPVLGPQLLSASN